MVMMGQQRADCENCGDTVTVSSLQERNILLDLGLTGRNTQW